MKTGSQSAFLILPAELRNRIYEHIFASPEETYRLERSTDRPAILDVCQRTRDEASGIFYSNTSFHLADPKVCVQFLADLPFKLRDLIQEIRYDCCEVCEDPRSWRMAFQDLPGMDEDRKLEKLRASLTQEGIFLRDEVLKVGLKVNGRLRWTADPLGDAREAVENGWLVGRVMFV